MEAHARQDGPGHNYLVQHSAGSGKSSTIAWLAYRLSNLHNVDNDEVSEKVIVVTDRVVLDHQLQATVAQFEKVSGVVEKIAESSQQHTDALAGEQARIIITTIQKFPFVLEEIEELPGRSYAVLADEAHSSQLVAIRRPVELQVRPARLPERRHRRGEHRCSRADPTDRDHPEWASRGPSRRSSGGVRAHRPGQARGPPQPDGQAAPCVRRAPSHRPTHLRGRRHVGGSRRLVVRLGRTAPHASSSVSLLAARSVRDRR